MKKPSLHIVPKKNFFYVLFIHSGHSVWLHFTKNMFFIFQFLRFLKQLFLLFPIYYYRYCSFHFLDILSIPGSRLENTFQIYLYIFKFISNFKNICNENIVENSIMLQHFESAPLKSIVLCVKSIACGPLLRLVSVFSPMLVLQHGQLQIFNKELCIHVHVVL